MSTSVVAVMYGLEMSREAGAIQIVLSGGEERIGRLYFDPNAALAACFDFENSVPTYNEIMQLRSDPKMLAANLVSELPL